MTGKIMKAIIQEEGLSLFIVEVIQLTKEFNMDYVVVRNKKEGRI